MHPKGKLLELKGKEGKDIFSFFFFPEAAHQKPDKCV